MSMFAAIHPCDLFWETLGDTAEAAYKPKEDLWKDIPRGRWRCPTCKTWVREEISKECSKCRLESKDGKNAGPKTL